MTIAPGPADTLTGWRLTLTSPSWPRSSSGGPPKQRFGDREIARELAPLLLLQPLGNAAPDELLDVGGVAPEHPRQTGEILAALGT